MQYRYLGNSGLVVSEMAYGNWITMPDRSPRTPPSRVFTPRLTPASPPSTPLTSTRGPRPSRPGPGLGGPTPGGLEIFTKVYWPTGPGKNDRGLSRKHIIESCHGSLRRLGVDYIDLYQAHRFDYETPLEETLRAFDDLVRAGKVMYVGVSEWRGEEIEAAVEIASQMGFDRIISNQPQYSMLYRVIESEVIPVREQRDRADRVVPAGTRGY